jgi:hypothetical protein
VLLGVVGADGRLGSIRPPMIVDDEFVTRATAGRIPESRFRFAEGCVEGPCAQWTGDRCGLIDEVLEAQVAEPPAEADEAPAVPRCGIRPTCRWYSQRGLDACSICPLVIHTPRTLPSA